jgi:cobalt-zinc-cadmium resistance protein CzcA
LLEPPKGDGDHDTKLIKALKSRYLKLLDLAMSSTKRTVQISLAAFALATCVLPFLGTAFIPEMKEGSIVPGINRVPNISLTESIKMEMQAMQLVMTVPGVKSAVSGVGRGESPADPQSSQRINTHRRSLKPRNEWPSGWDQNDITEAIREKLKALPGVQIVTAQPISARVAEMVTGVAVNSCSQGFWRRSIRT